MSSAEHSARSQSRALQAEIAPVETRPRLAARQGAAPAAYAPLHKSHRGLERPPFECIALVLQGGGALGAFQAGVYQALAEADLHPDWVCRHLDRRHQRRADRRQRADERVAKSCAPSGSRSARRSRSTSLGVGAAFGCAATSRADFSTVCTPAPP